VRRTSPTGRRAMPRICPSIYLSEQYRYKGEYIVVSVNQTRS
jgi:hypothetical protein